MAPRDKIDQWRDCFSVLHFAQSGDDAQQNLGIVVVEQSAQLG